jgi:hypothetical protein
MPSAIGKALNAATGEIGAASLKAAVQKHAGGKGVARLREIRADIKKEMGGNIVKGPRADELKKRLQAEGLLPTGKAKSVEPEAPKGLASIFNKNMKPAPEAPKSVPTDLKKGLAALPLPTDIRKELAALAAKDQQLENPKAPSVKKPDSQFGTMATGRLENQLAFMKIAGQKDLVDRMEKEIEKRKAVEKKAPTTATGNTVYTKQEAADFDKSFKPEKRQGGTYDWNETSKSGTKKIGEGSFGAVLMTKGPPPVAVKRGRISSKEAEIIDKIGKADLGPRLIAGETAKISRTEYGVTLKDGRIAMSVVPGKQLMDMKSDTKIGNTTAGDAYWKARAELHRLGIAHNDAHPGNLLIDKTGKGRWVDMGLAHDHPGAALAEALGVLRKPAGAVGVGGGDWQGQGWAAKTGNSDGRVTSFAPENLKRMQSNHDTKVLPFLQSKGLTDDEIGTVMTNGIRRPPTEYTTMKGFDKLNDDDALQAINLLYDGI